MRQRLSIVLCGVVLGLAFRWGVGTTPEEPRIRKLPLPPAASEGQPEGVQPPAPPVREPGQRRVPAR
jgi:hypothetical protein